MKTVGLPTADSQKLLSECMIALGLIAVSAPVLLVMNSGNQRPVQQTLPECACEARRLEQAVFTAASALYNGVKGSDGSFVLDCQAALLARADQYAYEALEFTGLMRTKRTYLGILPSYILWAHYELIKVPAVARVS